MKDKEYYKKEIEEIEKILEDIKSDLNGLGIEKGKSNYDVELFEVDSDALVYRIIPNYHKFYNKALHIIQDFNSICLEDFKNAYKKACEYLDLINTIFFQDDSKHKFINQLPDFRNYLSNQTAIFETAKGIAENRDYIEVNMNNNKEETEKKNNFQIIKESKITKWGIIIAIITIGIAIIGGSFWFGYYVGKIETLKNNTIEKPEFNFTYEPEGSGNSFKTYCSLKNMGNATATEIKGKIESNVELEYGTIQLGDYYQPSLAKGSFISEDKKIFTFWCRRLFSKEILGIRFQSKEIPKLVTEIQCNELSK